MIKFWIIHHIPQNLGKLVNFWGVKFKVIIAERYWPFEGYLHFFSKWNQVLGILNWGSISSTYSWQIWIICISMLMLLIRPNWWFYVRLLGQTFQANLSNYFEKFGSYPLISDMFLFLLFTNFWDLRQR